MSAVRPPLSRLLLAASLLACTSAQADQEVQEGRARTYERIESLRMKVEGNVTLTAGSFNSLADQLMPEERRGADLPSQDVVVPVATEVLLDFKRNRSRISGNASVIGKIKKLLTGELTVIMVHDESQTAFDGEAVTGVKPKELRDSRGLPATTPPVEFYNVVPNSLADVTYDASLLPIFMYAGALPGGLESISAAHLRADLDSVVWTRRLPTDVGDSLIVVVSEPDGRGNYAEAGICPEFGYRPDYWSLYMRGVLRKHIDMHYHHADAGVRLLSWTAEYYDEGATLQKREEFSVTETEVNPLVVDGLFRLTPSDGMITQTLRDGGISFGKAGTSLTAATHQDIVRLARPRRYWLVARVFAVVGIAICALYLVLRSHDRGKESRIVRSKS